MRRKKIENMKRAELITEAEAVGIEVKKGMKTKKLMKLVDESRTAAIEMVRAAKTEKAELVEEAIKPVIDVVQERSWAGTYELICDAYVNDGKHKRGESVRLTNTDAKLLLAQGAISIL